MIEVTRSLHYETMLRAFALRRHDRDGAGKPQGARIIDHERSRHLGQVARHERDGGGQEEIPRHERIGHLFDMTLIGRLERFGLLDHRDDVAQLAGMGIVFHPHEDLALFKRGSCIDRVADLAGDGERLAGERALVDCGGAPYDGAVDGNLLAKSDDDDIADMQVRNLDIALVARFEGAPRFARDREQGTDQAALAAAMRIVFKRIIGIEKEHDVRGRVGFALQKPQGDRGRIKHGNIQTLIQKRLESQRPGMALTMVQTSRRGRGRRTRLRSCKTSIVATLLMRWRGRGAKATESAGSHCFISE